MTNATVKLNGLYESLTVKIEQSVNHLKEKEATFENTVAKPAVRKNSAQVSLAGFAFGYLEPNLAYNIHKISSELEAEQDLRREQGANKGVEEEEGQEKEAIQKNETVEEANFAESLQNYFMPDAKFVTEAYKKNDVSAPSAAPIMLSGGQYTQYRPEYAAQAYDYVFALNREETGTIEYMYKNNQSFDYRV